MTSTEGTGQLALVPSVVPPRRRAPKPAQEPAALLPVARVAVDTGLAHLDRLFDYAVPADLDERAVPGCRVKVRFAGQLVDGFVTERVDVSEHEGRLSFVAKVVSDEPVLQPDVLALARAVADRYAGTLSDVLRLAVPPRHATVEKSSTEVAETPLPEPSAAGWGDYVHGLGFVAALRAGESPRACWSALPGREPAREVAEAARATLDSGRGVVVCVADQRDVDRWAAVFAEVLGSRAVSLTAGQKPAARYRSFLRLSRGQVDVVVGTRAAAFAPVHDVGLVVIFDDGNDLFAEPRAPYPHAREVLLTRAAAAGAGVLVGGHARSAEAQHLVETGWCAELNATLATRRAAWPRVQVTDGSDTGQAPVRLPRAVFTTIRDAQGPVLVQVPRRGYRPSLSCQDCRQRASCRHCHGPLVQVSASTPPSCAWCGAAEPAWECTQCHGRRLRAPVVGQHRAAEEFAQAFADRTVLTSGGSHVLDIVEQADALVLATPGAEPPATSGYAAVVVLDTWLSLGREDMRVVEESHRRWFNALALARPGARSVVVGEPSMLQALVRTDPAGFAVRELQSRREVHLPPVARLATIESSPDVIDGLLERQWTPHTEVLGPVPVHGADDMVRLIVRAPRQEGPQLAAALKALAAERSAAKLPPVRIQIDPPTL